MDGERRMGTQDLLVELLERVAKIETRGEARDAWQAAIDAAFIAADAIRG